MLVDVVSRFHACVATSSTLSVEYLNRPLLMQRGAASAIVSGPSIPIVEVA